MATGERKNRRRRCLLTTVRVLFAIAVHEGIPVLHADIPQAFLKAKMDTDVWFKLPPGILFRDKNGKAYKVLKLLRALYGLRSSPQAFNKELVRFMTQPSLGFQQLTAECC